MKKIICLLILCLTTGCFIKVDDMSYLWEHGQTDENLLGLWEGYQKTEDGFMRVDAFDFSVSQNLDGFFKIRTPTDSYKASAIHHKGIDFILFSDQKNDQGLMRYHYKHNEIVVYACGFWEDQVHITKKIDTQLMDKLVDHLQENELCVDMFLFKKALKRGL
jgi:hypothetical protein